MKPINYGKQEITQDDIDAVVNALKGDYLTQGPTVAAFEDSFRAFVRAEHAIAVTNATSALHIANLALGVTGGSRVITTPLSFVATSNSVIYAGGEVKLIDIDPITYCLDANRVEDELKKSKSGTYSGIIPVSFAGYPVNMEDFKFLANRYHLWLIEDACHAPGAKFKKQDQSWAHTGSGEFADLSIFSFHPVKHIATGEGGMITTRDAKLAQKLRDLRSHGIVREPSRLSKSDGPWYYEMKSLGYNFRMPDLLCALGISQLKRIEANLNRRNEIADNYNLKFKNHPITLPKVKPDSFHAYHLFVIQTDKRNELYEFLKSKNINCQIHYIPIHTQPYYIERYGRQSFPLSEMYYNKTLSLPMYHGMTEIEQNFVIEQICLFFNKQGN